MWGRIPVKRYCMTLEEWFPDVATEWHPTKNGRLKPSDVSGKSGKRVWWQCAKGHEWEATIVNRTAQRSRCPFCRRWYSRHPEIAAQWHPTKNDGLAAKDVSTAYRKIVWWQCEKGHEWQDTIISRLQGRGCPVCIGERK